MVGECVRFVVDKITEHSTRPFSLVIQYDRCGSTDLKTRTG